MPPITATLSAANPEAVAKAAQAMNRDRNGPLRMIGDMNALRDVKFHIYIYNVGPLEHKIGRPWATNGRLRIPACPSDKEYGEPVVLPDVIQESVGTLGSNELRFVGRDGKFYAQDAINPDDPTGDWKTMHPINSGQSLNVGTNLYHWGVWWSLNSPPTPEEIAKAKERLSAHFNRLLTEADGLYIAQQASGYSGDRVNVNHHLAADYFGVETAWHRKYQARRPCPGCGNMLSEAAIVCDKCPATFDWPKAVALGLRTKKAAIEFGVEL
jgi:hypothetical protein